MKTNLITLTPREFCARHTPLADGRTTGDLLTDPRSLRALKVSEAFANGRAKADELAAAWDAAWAARAAAGATALDARAAAGDAQCREFRRVIKNPFPKP